MARRLLRRDPRLGVPVGERSDDVRARDLLLLDSDEVRRRLKECATTEQRSPVYVIALLSRAEKDKSYFEEGFESLTAYCEGLGYTPHQASARARIAQAAVLHEEIIDDLERRALSPSAVRRLAPYLGGSGGRELLAAARHKSCRDIDLLLDRLFPESRKCRDGLRVKQLGDGRVRMSASVPSEVTGKLKLARELTREHGASDDVGALLSEALDRLIDARRQQPPETAEAASEASHDPAARTHAANSTPPCQTTGTAATGTPTAETVGGARPSSETDDVAGPTAESTAIVETIAGLRQATAQTAEPTSVNGRMSSRVAEDGDPTGPIFETAAAAEPSSGIGGNRPSIVPAAPSAETGPGRSRRSGTARPTAASLADPGADTAEAGINPTRLPSEMGSSTGPPPTPTPTSRRPAVRMGSDQPGQPGEVGETGGDEAGARLSPLPGPLFEVVSVAVVPRRDAPFGALHSREEDSPPTRRRRTICLAVVLE
jgi:hypothetical protein